MLRAAESSSVVAHQGPKGPCNYIVYTWVLKLGMQAKYILYHPE